MIQHRTFKNPIPEAAGHPWLGALGLLRRRRQAVAGGLFGVSNEEAVSHDRRVIPRFPGEHGMRGEFLVSIRRGRQEDGVAGDLSENEGDATEYTPVGARRWIAWLHAGLRRRSFLLAGSPPNARRPIFARAEQCSHQCAPIAMTGPDAQVLARLAWASHISAWGNVHPKMIPVISELIESGLVERVVRDNGLRLTEAGEEMLRVAGVPFVGDLASNGTAGKAHELVPNARFWTDQWGNRIPH